MSDIVGYCWIFSDNVRYCYLVLDIISIVESLELVLVLPDPGRALVLLGGDGGNAGIVWDGGVGDSWEIILGSDSSTWMEFKWGNIF